MTNRKSHTRFRLVPKSTTLDDLERPRSTLFQNTRVFGNMKIRMKIELYYQRRRCSPMTLVSGNIRFMRIFAGFSEDGRQTTVGLSKTAIFSTFARYFFKSFRDNAGYYIVLFTSSLPFHWPQNTWPWVTVNGHFMLISVLFLSTQVQKLLI